MISFHAVIIHKRLILGHSSITITITIIIIIIISGGLAARTIDASMIDPWRRRQSGHIEEVKYVQILELIGSRSASGRDGGIVHLLLRTEELTRLPRNQKIQIICAPTHVSENPHGTGGLAYTARRHRRAFGLAVFVHDPLQESRISLSDFPVVAHLSQRVDEGLYCRVDLVINGGTMYKQESGRHPETEGKRRSQLGQHLIVADIGA